MKSNTKNMVTLAYAGNKCMLKRLIEQMDELVLDSRGNIEKYEEGSDTDADGYVVKYTIGKGDKKRDIFFAMIHSNQKNYLIRAEDGLFSKVGENEN